MLIAIAGYLGSGCCENWCPPSFDLAFWALPRSASALGVRSLGQTGPDLLDLSSLRFDPERTQRVGSVQLCELDRCATHDDPLAFFKILELVVVLAVDQPDVYRLPLHLPLANEDAPILQASE